jgi:hypothetical protein
MPTEKLTEVRIFAQAARQGGRERERDLERETERCRAGKQGNQARERRGLSGNDARARQKSTQLAFHFSRSGLAWLIKLHWPGLDAVDNWALVTKGCSLGR